MKITIQDASEYFRGLLLLVRKDRQVTTPEKWFVMRVGKALGFEEAFCEGAIQDILGNDFVRKEPPRFGDPRLAKKFIRDGLMLADVDHHPDEREISWLREVAEKNGLDAEWFRLERRLALTRTQSNDGRLEAEGLSVDYEGTTRRTSGKGQ